MTIAPDQAEITRLYEDFARAGLAPLWTQTADLMPMTPSPKAVPHRWVWSEVEPLAARAGDLVAVGRGGERRAISYVNPGLGGAPFATPTLWAAVQYLGPEEVAPAHRHTPAAFRFILNGEGVWTVVDGDPVAMRRGDLLLTDGWAWHEHHNTASKPMTWLDGLDLAFVGSLDAIFFEFGPEEVSDRSTPDLSRSERLWGHAGLRPVGVETTRRSPLVAYRWAETDAALSAQLELAAGGHPIGLEEGHAAVRFSNPANGADALLTMRMEMHRHSAGTRTERVQTAGSSVWQVFSGLGQFLVGAERFDVLEGDVIAVPSWCPLSIVATTDLDVFMFCDAPILEAFDLDRNARP